MKSIEGGLREEGIYKNNQLYLGKRKEDSKSTQHLSTFEIGLEKEVEGFFEEFGVVKLTGRSIECNLKEFNGVKGWRTVGRIVMEGKDEFFEGSIFEGRMEGIGRHFKEGKLIYEGEFKGTYIFMYEI